MEGSVLVIGGGIAGIETSLDLIDLGFKVYLVEKSPSIGGHMTKLEKIFPTNDCALCMLAPKMVILYRNPNIEIFTLSKVKEVTGEPGNFTITIVKKPRYIDETKCKGCGDCAAKCPKIEVPNEFDMNLGKRKSVYIPFPQATPPIYLIDPKICLYMTRKVCGVCKKVCKAQAIDFEQEPKEIKIKVGAIVVATGFQILGEELTERWGYQYKNVLNALEYERVLCISGPFGGQILRPSDEQEPKKIIFIQCAGSLDLEENVPYCSRVCCLYTVKEAVLTRMYSKEIETQIFRHNIRAFGKNFYEFAETAQNEYGVEYLQTTIYNIEEESKTQDLIIRYRDLRSGEEKNARANMVVLAAPLVYSSGTKKLAQILNIELDKYGFFQGGSYYNKGLSTRGGIYLCGSCQGPMDISETVADASAIASHVSSFLNPVRYTRITELAESTKENNELIHITPAALIIGGGISGMTAALNIANQGYKTCIVEKENELGGNLRFLNILYPIQEKASEFLNEIKGKVDENKNIKVFLGAKIKDIKGSIGNYTSYIEDNRKEIQKVNIGTIIVASGAKEFKPVGLFQYGENNKNILTQMELEEKLKGEDYSWLDNINHITIILCVNARQKDGFSYCSNVCCNNSIKYINILKEIKPELNILVFFRDLQLSKKEFEDYFDNRKKDAKFIRYSLHDIPEIQKIKDDPEKYKIQIQDISNLDHKIEFHTDMIVLLTPLVPSDNLELARILNVSLDKNGFFEEAHVKLRPLDFANTGIFLCGCAQWPKNVQDSISQAIGAAGRASKFLSVKEISATKLKFLSFLFSLECHFKDLRVNIEKCNGCGKCVEICSFKAISLMDVKKEFEEVSFPMKKAQINPAICKGCGKCAATCRLKAISARHYNFDQVSAIIDPFVLGRGKRRDKEEQSAIIP